jgi:hypothetical protein
MLRRSLGRAPRFVSRMAQCAANATGGAAILAVVIAGRLSNFSKAWSNTVDDFTPWAIGGILAFMATTLLAELLSVWIPSTNESHYVG